MAEEGFLLSKSAVERLGTVFTKVGGPSRITSMPRLPNDNSTTTKQVRLIAVETPAPSASAQMIGYTAEVVKVDYSTMQMVSTGITFDPDGSVGDHNIVKSYVYEVNKNDTLAGKIFTVTYKYVNDSAVNGVWVFSGASGGGRPYLVITSVTDVNNYVANVITPTDITVIESNVSVKALQPEAGLLPIGTKIFSDLIDGVYYIEPSVFYGN